MRRSGGVRNVAAMTLHDLAAGPTSWRDTPAAPRHRGVHTGAGREFAYTTGAQPALEQAGAEDWTIVSMKDDWAAAF
jgi:hypothetical protein